MIRFTGAQMEICDANYRAKGVAGMNNAEENDRIQFCRESAEQWRLHACRASNPQSQEVRLQMALVWQRMAEELESPPAPTPAPSEQRRQPDEAAA